MKNGSICLITYNEDFKIKIYERVTLRLNGIRDLYVFISVINRFGEKNPSLYKL